MNEIKIKQTIEQLSSKVKNLKEEKNIQTSPLIEQVKAMEKSFDTQIYESNNSMLKLQEKYYDIAFDVAIENQRCPLSHSGGYLTPNEVEIDTDGISLTWIIQHPYNCDTYKHFTALWSDILGLEQKQLTETN